MSKGLIKSTSIYGLALLAERMLSFALLPVLVKTVSPTEYGIWAQAIVVTGVLTPIVLMGFQTALVKFFPLWETTLRVRDSVLLAMLSAIFASLFVVSAIIVALSGHIANLVFGQVAHVVYIPLLAGLLVSAVLFEFLVGILRATGRIRLIALYIFLQGFWRIGALLVVLYGMNGDFYKAFLAFVLVQLLFVALMYAKDVPAKHILRSGLAAGRAHWGEVLSFSPPLVALAVMIGLNNFTDRFFLAHLYGLDEVAVYAATYSLAAVVAFFYSMLGFTLFPALAEHWAQGRRDEAAAVFGRAMLVYLFLLCPFIAGMAVSGQDILAMLTTAEYKAPAMLGFLLACNVGLFGLYQIGFYVVLLERGSVHGLGLMGLVAGVNVLLNALLVPALGMTGAALSGFASNALLAGVTLYMASRVLDWHFPWAVSLRIALRVGIMAAFIWLTASWLGVSHSIGLLAVLFIAALLYVALDFLDRKTSLFILVKTL